MRTICLILTCLLIELGSMRTFAGSQSIPGPGGGSGADIGENSVLTRSDAGLINPLTGIAAYHIKLLSMNGKNGFNVGVDFHFTGNMQSRVQSPNWLSPQSWCGTGWHMGFSHIYVKHQNTTDMSDDKWYYVYSEGVVSEIVDDDGTWRVKNAPYWTVTPHYNQPDPGDYKVIDGWTIIFTNGYTYRYGDFGTGTKNAGRNLKCSGNTIATTVTSDIRDFYYQWDIAEAEDIDGRKITFTYQPTTATINGNQYVRESYIQTIENDVGDKFVFQVGNKSYEEIGFQIHSDAYKVYDSKFLSQIQYVDKDNNPIEEFSLEYIVDGGDVGLRKRFLSAITSTHLTGMRDYFFRYDMQTYKGYLTEVSHPKLGKTVSYVYKTQECTEHQEDGTQVSHDVVVIDKTISSGGVAGTPDIEAVYAYTTDPTKQRFDVVSGIAHWGEVVEDKGRGTVKLIYEMDDATNLFGSLKETQFISESGQVVAKSKTIQQPIEFGSGDDVWYYKEVTKTERTRDGVTAIAGSPYCRYNSTNGLTGLTYAINSDGAAVLKKRTFAYELYPAMGQGTGNKNMLSQQAALTIYKKESYTAGSCDLSAATVIGGHRTVWGVIDGVWRPQATYVWNVPMDGNGEPVTAFVDFDAANPTANGWQLNGTVDRYNSYGQAVQASNALGTPATTIYRNDLGLPIANVRNASFKECGAFTGDYNTGEDAAYWDKENGWEKGTAASIETQKGHFSTRCIHVTNDYAAGRNNVIVPGKTYVMSAWVKVVSGKIFIATDYRYAAAGYENEWPQQHAVADGQYGADKVELTAADCSGDWKLLTLQIPASKTTQLPNDRTWYARAWIGNHNDFGSTEGVEAYIDDIRFHPSDALLQTTYYHEKWRKPVVEVDANNNPGRRAEFDYAGRASKLWKPNRSKGSDDTDWGVLIEKKEYHIRSGMYNGPALELIWPNGGEEIELGRTYAIEWMQDESVVDRAHIYLSSDNGNTWHRINPDNGLVPSSQGNGCYFWKALLPDGIPTSSNCKMKIASAADGAVSEESDAVFAIRNSFTPPAVVLPANGGKGFNMLCGSLLLSWKGVSNFGQPATYEIHFGTSSNPPKVATFAAADQWGESRCGNDLAQFGYQVYDLSENTKYYWKIIATVGGQALSSPTWSFTTGSNAYPPHSECTNDDGWTYVLSPNGGETYNVGEKVYVMWLGDNNSGCSSVVLRYEDEGGYGSEIPTGHQIEPDDWEWGCFEWRIPAEVSGKSCKIVVQHYCGGDLPGMDISDEAFQIESVGE